jgi:uncharacterized membrane protein
MKCTACGTTEAAVDIVNTAPEGIDMDTPEQFYIHTLKVEELAVSEQHCQPK